MDKTVSIIKYSRFGLLVLKPEFIVQQLTIFAA